MNEAGAKDSSIDMGSHPPVLFVLCGLCHSISSRLSAIAWNMSSRSSCGAKRHRHNVTVVEMSTVVVVEFVVVVERHFMVMMMGWWLVWKLESMLDFLCQTSTTPPEWE